jgi:hypothetical protein
MNTMETVDSPRIPLYEDAVLARSTVKEDFRMFLVWRPLGLSQADGRIVLGMVEWGWSAEVVNHAASRVDEDWELISSEKRPLSIGQGGPTSEKPVLSPKVQDFEYQPIP